MSRGGPRVRDRRRVLRAFVNLCGIVSLGPSVGSYARSLEPVGVEDWLRGFGASALGGTADLGRLGAIYLAEHPRERDRKRLVQQLEESGSGAVVLGLIERIARDWREHDVVTVAGWVLARTECRICALLHLMGGKPE